MHTLFLLALKSILTEASRIMGTSFAPSPMDSVIGVGETNLATKATTWRF